MYNVVTYMSNGNILKGWKNTTCKRHLSHARAKQAGSRKSCISRTWTLKLNHPYARGNVRDLSEFWNLSKLQLHTRKIFQKCSHWNKYRRSKEWRQYRVCTSRFDECASPKFVNEQTLVDTKKWPGWRPSNKLMSVHLHVLCANKIDGFWPGCT